MVYQINIFITFFLVLLISLCGIILNHRNILVILMSLELMFFSISIIFILSSIQFDSVIGQIFSLLILTVAASESAIGLAFLVIYYRIQLIISIEFLNLMKG
uniref:Nad4L n=1 Tax=Pterocladiophila hemisphaerica TaxID=2712948 RepID=A0A6M3WWW5_9FLOR|nr:Nad4L [Pterocladiophila hemisphaerica]